MVFQGFCTVGYGIDSLGEVEGDACEAVFVEVDFLVVGDLADRAGWREVSVSWADYIGETRLQEKRSWRLSIVGPNLQYRGRKID